ncbi:sensor histidine kinase [Cylindrospermum sp. FACHB-282]|uniref:sensor histidine kinase n=1 Tax=Cylindrospermum sp. FACHB-282 TaxID=2692794 RepID=UPI0016842DA6|nr:HAMP domain-containing sensor histidine kinase [Cylindrospermum sp. FACHB-282]MBD2386737.1 HAMP domain-containing histidine kinase [Cylindrospermum sp. FACHB-282]
MNVSDWVYLGAGIALGMGFCGLFARSAKATSGSSSVLLEEQQHLPLLLQQVKQTQLAYEMAAQMSQFKAGFLARTTHELRSPLNGLIGLHQLILSDLCEDPAEEREFIAQAHERALKLLKLIDEILSIARTEHGNSKLDIQPLALAEVLQEVDKLTYMLAANRNFPFLVLPPAPETYVLADPRWLRQVLVNLVDTAISQMEFGSLCLSSRVAPTNNFVYIWLDVPTHAVPWSEPIDLIKSEDKPVEENVGLSPGMKLLLNQTLMEVMGGKLEILLSPTDKEAKEQLTRLQVSIPLVIPEAEFPQLAENPS